MSIGGVRQSHQEWITVLKGARRLGISGSKVRKLALDGTITSLRLPGNKPLVSWPDLERVFAAGVRKGTG